jgi:hypothetical protein
MARHASASDAIGDATLDALLVMPGLVPRFHVP